MINLYIDKQYCLTIEQLKQYFTNLCEGSDIYWDLLDYAKYGDLSNWLYEHNEGLLAESVNSIDQTIGDSDYMNRLSGIFGSESLLTKPLYNECFQIRTVNYEVTEENIRVFFPLSILKSINENYSITLKSSWEIKIVNINTYNYMPGEVITLNITLSPMPENKIEDILIFIDDEEYCSMKIIPNYSEYNQFLVIEQEQTHGQKSYLQVFDSNGNSILSTHESKASKLIQIPGAVLNGYKIGYLEETGDVYFIAENGCQKICTWDISGLNSLTCALINRIGDLCCISLRDGTECIRDFIIKEGTCFIAEEYILDFCKKHKIPYTIRDFGQSNSCSVSNNSPIKVLEYINIEYIGEDNGEAIFLACNRNYERCIINSQGKVKWLHEYNGIVSPTRDKSLYIATNSGRKYKMFMLMRKGKPIETYRIKGQISPTILNETETSYTISSHEKYLKAPLQGVLIFYIPVNQYFYIKTAIYSQNNSEPTACTPELYLASTDKSIMMVQTTYEFNNLYYQELGEGYIAVMKYDTKNTIVIIAPDGEVVYTLKKYETIVQRSKGAYYHKCGLGESEGAFIVRESGSNLYKVLAHGGSEICRFNTDEYIAHGFHAGRCVFHDNYKIGYFDEKGISHNIPWNKNKYIYSLKVLANCNIVVNYESKGVEKWGLFDIHGKEILSSKNSIEVIG